MRYPLFPAGRFRAGRYEFYQMTARLRTASRRTLLAEPKL